MNYSDAARIKAVLNHCGYIHTEDINEADIVVFDTCSVRQKSEDKVFGKLLEIPKDKKVWLTGCMIQHHLRNGKIENELNDKKINGQMKLGNFVGNIKNTEPQVLGITNKELEELDRQKDHSWNIVFINHAYNPLFVNMQKEHPHVELFFRIDDTGFLPLMMKKLGYTVQYDQEITNEYTSIIPHSTNQLFKENTKTAYIPISKGCSQFCAYCIVPYARGLEKNRPVEEILKEVDIHLEQGIEEIVLLWQIVNKHPDFVKICKEILKKPQLKWLRYTSPYPTFFSPELLELHEKEEKMCPHIHMPLQSWSNEILKKMFRGYSVEEYKTFVDMIRWLKRPISITTDIIIGFPDETEEDFQGSMELIEYAKFDMIYMGIYSPRPGTLGAKKYSDNISKQLKHQRRTVMNDFLIKISYENNKQELWTIRECIINKIEENHSEWYTDNMKTVIINIKSLKEKNIKLWDFTKVKITDIKPFKLIWELI